MQREKKASDEISHVSSKASDDTQEIKPYIFLKNLSDKLDSAGIEINGIERVSPDRRSTNKFKQFITVIGLWVSGCAGLTSMSSFYLGPMLYGLGLKRTLIAGVLGQFLGCLVAAYCSLMGPRSGCRQMVTARFLFGWWMVKFVAFIGIVGGIGWSVVNCIVGGQVLSSVSDGRVPLVASIVIIAMLTLVITVGGIKVLLRAESFLSIPIVAASLMLYIASASKYKYLSWADSSDVDLNTLRGNTASFFSLCYSITATWGANASDYYTLFPQDTPNVQIFLLTFLGTLLPTTLVGVIAILTGNIAMNYGPWTEAYEELSMGGLLGAAFKPWGGGGKFLLVLMYLSLVCNTVMTTYSTVFQLQIIARPLARVPRWLWSCLITVVYLLLAIFGRYKFATILGNFLPMIGYWISIYVCLLLEENTIFRTAQFRHLYTEEFRDLDSDASSFAAGKSCNYNFLIWNSQKKLTQGYAATVAFACGAAGAAVGMSQTYWTGPLAKKVGGDYGGDIAMWLCMGFSGVVYPWLRYLELKNFGR